jgi:hypothetical protein
VEQDQQVRHEHESRQDQPDGCSSRTCETT